MPLRDLVLPGIINLDPLQLLMLQQEVHPFNTESSFPPVTLGLNSSCANIVFKQVIQIRSNSRHHTLFS